ncbi:MAG: hypothetical protein J6A78_00185 [Clostridia bacterium]|nr:hypothetical protein [Clostridia bacterium]
MDLISSEAKPKISSALADFTLASARISFMQGLEFIRKTSKNIFFVAHRQRITASLIQVAVIFFLWYNVEKAVIE